jgi:hypothetical protein
MVAANALLLLSWILDSRCRISLLKLDEGACPQGASRSDSATILLASCAPASFFREAVMPGSGSPKRKSSGNRGWVEKKGFGGPISRLAGLHPP